MYTNQVKRAADKVIKKLNGDISVSSVVRCIEELGFSVIYFNTREGFKLIELYGLLDNAAKLPAFTYCDDVKYVFVDNKAHSADKLYLLLHELGHIVLGHLDGDKTLLEHNLRLDNEAESFSYYVLNNKKSYVLPCIALTAVTAAAILIKAR